MKYLNKISVTIMIIFSLSSSVTAVEISLRDALKRASEKSNRSAIIAGDLEVAEQSYHAERINFYVPDISIKGSVPVYNVSESFGNIYGQNEQSLIRRTSLDYNADITLEQSLITGGEFLVSGQLVKNRSEEPQTAFDGQLVDVTRKTEQGVFDFSFTQPLLKPSEPKNKLRNKRDDLEIARVNHVEETTKLKEEVIDSYFGVLQTNLKYIITENELQSSRIKNRIDSVKFSDGIKSEEEWLESESSRLDAELNMYDVENELVEKNRELALLLDYDVTERIKTTTPVMTEHISDKTKQFYLDNWETSNPIIKASRIFAKDERAANFNAASHGLSGTFTANYKIGRGEYSDDFRTEDNNTDSWGMRVNFTLPLWDGGAKGAEIKAARLSAQKSELEFERTKRSQRAEIANLINQLDISYRKLSVLQKQIELANTKLGIADFRFKDGQISNLEFLESKIYYLKAQDKYLEELKEYFKNKVKLEGEYSL